MKTPQLPVPLATYFAGVNSRDVDAAIVPFADNAVVKDEGRQRRGRSAIREWIEETTAKYQPVVEVTQVDALPDKATATGRVSGNFPGSPIELQYRFGLEGEKIVSLEIG